MRMRWSIMVVLLGAVLVGCSAIESFDVPTSSIEPWIRVVSTPVATEVEVALLGPGFGQNFITLGSADVLSVAIGAGAPVALTVTDPRTVNTRYVASLPAVAPGTELVFGLTRVDFDDAPQTRVVVPVAPVVTGPAADSTFSNADDVNVTWVPFADDQVELRLAVTTCFDATADEEDTVRALVDLLDETYDGTAATGTISFLGVDLACDADLLVGRFTTEIDLDPAFGDVDGRTRTIRAADPIPLSFVP
jgi:hypothetical protein